MRDWDDHRLILALHRHGTLRATGESLGVTHTTIARRLAAIQADENSALFTRSGRAYKVTTYGRTRVRLAEKIEKLDYEASRLKKGAEQNLSGSLSLSIPQAVYQYLLIDEIAAFARLFPEIELRVVGTDKLADLDRGEADVVIRGHANPPNHLVGRQICSVGLSHYAHREYLRNTRREDRQWISPPPQNGQSHFRPDWIANSSHPNSSVSFVIDDIQSRFLALTAGHGLARAACFMADPHPNLVRLEDSPVIPLYGLWVLTHPDLKSSPKVRALVTALSQALSTKKDLIIG